MNHRKLGFVVAGLSFVGLALSPQVGGQARAAEERKPEQKGGQKSCGGDKGCGAERNGKTPDKQAGDGKAQPGTEKDKAGKTGGKKDCGGPKGCGAGR